MARDANKRSQSEIQLSRRDKLVMLVALTIGMTCSFGIDMHLPSLPSIVSYFHSTVSLGQLSVSLYVMSMMVFQLIYGPLSDRIGRKPVILLGLFIAVIGSVVCITAQSMAVFLLGRVIQGMGAAVGLGLGRSLINDVFSREKMIRYGSYVSIVLSLGLLIAPTIGGYSQSLFGWRGTFCIMGAFFIIAFVLVALLLTETADMGDHRGQPLVKMLKDYGYLLKQRPFLVYSLCTGLGLGLTLTYSSMSSFIFQGRYHQTAIVYGWVSACIAFGSLIGKVISSQCASRLGVRYGVVSGFCLFFVAGALMLLCNAVFTMWVLALISLIFFGTLGMGFISANSVAGALSDHRSMSGTAAALYGAFQNLIGFTVSLVISVGGFHSITSFALSYLLLSVVGIVLLACL